MLLQTIRVRSAPPVDAGVDLAQDPPVVVVDRRAVRAAARAEFVAACAVFDAQPACVLPVTCGELPHGQLVLACAMLWQGMP